MKSVGLQEDSPEVQSAISDVPRSSSAHPGVLPGIGGAVKSGVTGLESFVNSPGGQFLGNSLATGIRVVGNRFIPGLGSLASLAFRGIGMGLHGLLTGFGHLIGAPTGYPEPGATLFGMGPDYTSPDWRDNAQSGTAVQSTPDMEVTKSNAGTGVFSPSSYTNIGAPIYQSGWSPPAPGQGPPGSAPSSFGQPPPSDGGWAPPAPLPGTDAPEDETLVDKKDKGG